MDRWSIDEIRILHVDDDPKFLDVAAAVLEQHDDRFSVSNATDPAAARDRLATEEVHCVVSDYEMPDTDGIELLESVRREYPDLPFILYTGKGSEDVAGDAIAAGVTDYLQKKPGADQFELLANRIQNAVSQYIAERSASRIARQFEEVTEATNEALWMVAADWSELIYINSAYEDIWGRTVEDLSADPTDFLEAIHPDDRDRVRNGMEGLTAGESVDVEFRVNAEANWDRWVWVQAEPIFDEDGEVDRIAGFTRDVTDRKESTERRELMARIVDEMSDGIVVVQDGTVRFANPRMGELVGRASEELVGTELPEMIAPSDRDRIATGCPEHAPDAAEATPTDIELATSSDDRVRVAVRECPFVYEDEPARLLLFRERPESE